MFRWTDSDVGAVIDLVARSVGYAKQVGDHFSQLLQELSDMLYAESWRFEIRDVATADALAATNNVQQSQSRARETGNLRCVADFVERYGDYHTKPKPSVARSSRKSDCVVVTTDCSCQSADLSHPVIACLWFNSPGQLHCVEFSRGQGRPAYCEREQALLRVLGNQLKSASTVETKQHSCVQPISALSRRQREVLDLLTVGKNCKQIASELGLSAYTVNDYIKAIYRRYDVSCRAELLATIYFGV